MPEEVPQGVLQLSRVAKFLRKWSSNHQYIFNFRSLGTDTGGSVSYPAHCCGLYSMKPSYGRLSRFGQILYASSNDVIGPMTRSVEDLETLFSKVLSLSAYLTSRLNGR